MKLRRITEKINSQEVKILKKHMNDLNTHALKCVKKIEELKSNNEFDSILPSAEKSFLAITSAIQDANKEIEDIYGKYLRPEENKKDNISKETQQELLRTSKDEYLHISKKGVKSGHQFIQR